MARRLRWSSLALEDLAGIRSYLQHEAGERVAARAMAGIRDRVRKVRDSPFAWEERAEWGEGVRRALFGPYLLVYEVDDAHVGIIRVLHGALDLDAIFFGDGEE